MSISWSVELQDKVSGPANASAKAMGEAAQQAKVLQSALNQATDAITKASALGDVKGYRRATQNAESLKAAISLLPPAEEKVEEKTESMFASMFKAEAAMEALKVGAELAIEAVKVLGETMLEGAKFAIEASEGTKLLTAQLGALSEGANEANAEEAGANILKMLRGLEKEIPQSEKQVGSWARTLMAAGVTDMSKLRDSIKAIAGAEALVEGGGEKVKGILAKLNEAAIKGSKIKFSVASLAGTGLTEAEVMKQLGMTPKQLDLAKKQGTITGTQIADAMTRALAAKSAGPLADQMGELSTMWTKAKDSIGRIFESVNIKPFIDSLREFFSIFDAANPSGQVVRDMIVGAFNAVFRIAGTVFTFLKSAFLHLMIWGLEAAIAIKPIVRGFEEWYAKVGGATILMTALKGVGIVLGSLAVALGIVVVAAGAVAAGITIMTTAVIGVVAYIIGMVPRAGEALGDLAFHAVEAAKDFVAGLVNGIKNGVGLVVDAVKNMGHAAWSAIKGVLGISSPSTVMLHVGANVSEGMAIGIRSKQGLVEDASIGMSSAAVPAERPASSSAGTGAAGSSSSKSTTINLGGITVEINAAPATSSHELRAIVEEEFASLANRLALIIGSAPETT